MLLAVDIGNTQTVAGLFAPDTPIGDDPTVSWRTRTLAERTTDELAAQCAQILSLHGLQLDSITRCIVSSVVPSQLDAWEAVGERFLRVPVIAVGPGVRTGMQVRVDNPHEVGADRIVNAIAAWERYGTACIVVDMGTATTLDAIAPDGAYVGGAIAPGLGISIDALVQHAARLSAVPLEVPERAIGTSTAVSMQSGSLLGCVAQLEGLLTRFRRELTEQGAGDSIPAVATGGLAGLVAEHVGGLDHYDSELTLRGLQIIASRSPG